MSSLPVPSSLYAPAVSSNGFPITPSDSLLLPACTRKIYVGATGDLSVVLNEQQPNVKITPDTLDATYTASTVVLDATKLQASTTSDTLGTTRAVDAVSGGKYLVEFTVQKMGGGAGHNNQQLTLGICDAAFPNTEQLGQSAVDLISVGLVTQTLGNHSFLEFGNGSIGVDYGSASGIVDGDVIGLALDLTTGANKLHVYKNGVQMGTGFDLTANSLGGKTWFFAASLVEVDSAPSVVVNFGAPLHPVAGYGQVVHVVTPTPILLKGVPAGVTLDLAACMVFATGTGATELVGLY